MGKLLESRATTGVGGVRPSWMLLLASFWTLSRRVGTAVDIYCCLCPRPSSSAEEQHQVECEAAGIRLPIVVPRSLSASAYHTIPKAISFCFYPLGD